MAGIEKALITPEELVSLFPAPGTTVNGLPLSILEKTKYNLN
jgi:hypothetical protein